MTRKQLPLIVIGMTCALMLFAQIAAAETQEELENNKTIAKRISEEVVFQGKAADELLAPNFLYHPFGGGELDREATLHMWEGIRNAYPDAVITWNHAIAEGDKVVLHFTMQGTNTGEFLGMPATGKTAVWSGFVIRRIENGMVAEEWDLVDLYGMLVQLGVIPAPEPK